MNSLNIFIILPADCPLLVYNFKIDEKKVNPKKKILQLNDFDTEFS